jgi:hypothetical protein
MDRRSEQASIGAEGSNSLSVLLIILNLFPAILGAIQAVEVAVPIPGAGKAKLELVMGTLTDAAEQNLPADVSMEQLFQAVVATVSRIVATFNALGIFTKSKST